MSWSAEYLPWTPIMCAPIPVPWAAALGVPVTHVELPGPVAAASASSVIEVAQVIAAVRICIAQAEMEERRAAALRATFSGRMQEAITRRYAPPLARMICPVCGDAADCWVDDNGHIEDARDVVCAKSHAPEVMIQLRDGTA